MGASSSEQPESDAPAEPWAPPVADVPPVARAEGRVRRFRSWLFFALLAATILSTAAVGGVAYSTSILAILGAHEMGHYLACRYYRVDASLPYFLPMPILATGTLGAFIRIRAQIPGKRALFDIGIAGPIAGFLVAIPVLMVGIYLSEIVPIEPGILWLGEPLLLKAAVWVIHGSLPDGYTIATHPVAFAAWFGLLATAINLFPIGQLDGGHITYAVLGARSTQVTVAGVVALIVLSFVSSAWIVWAVMTTVMLLAFGPRHPRTTDEDVPLDVPRLWLAGFALVMLIVCFTPVPIEFLDLVE